MQYRSNADRPWVSRMRRNIRTLEFLLEPALESFQSQSAVSIQGFSYRVYLTLSLMVTMLILFRTGCAYKISTEVFETPQD